MIEPTKILLWRLLALTALLLGVIGVVLPVLPTVPFLILSAWAAGKGWPALELRLLAHPTYGRHIRQWRERGAVPRKAKLLASALMLASGVTIQFSPVPIAVRIGVPLFLVGVGVWLWSRPEH